MVLKLYPKTMFKNVQKIACHNGYALLWALGYMALWATTLDSEWKNEWWQAALLFAVAAMMIPWAWGLPNILTLPKCKKTKNKYKRRKTTAISSPDLSQKTKSISHESLTHMQMKLSTGVVRAYMMKPYYVTYLITYVASQDNKPADVVFRRYRHQGKDCQYYYDKALAHLTSCHLENMMGFMSDRHSSIMTKQARDACRKLIMSLDPEHIDDECPKLFDEINNQAINIAHLLLPQVRALTPRILPTSRPGFYSLPEPEIIHWFHYLDQYIEENT